MIHELETGKRKLSQQNYAELAASVEAYFRFLQRVQPFNEASHFIDQLL
jgi:hypothetical protein